MSTIITSKAQRIRTLASELDQLGKTALEKAIEAGSLLRECKAALDHGQWLPWLKSNFSFTDRTARNWMRISEASASGKLETVSDLTEAYRITTETKTNGGEVRATAPAMPPVHQRLLLKSPAGDIAAIEPIDDTYVQVTFTEPGFDSLLNSEIRILSIAGTKRGIHKNHAWEFLTKNTHADWNNAATAYFPWNSSHEIRKTTRNLNLCEGNGVDWVDEAFSLDELETGGIKP